MNRDTQYRERPPFVVFVEGLDANGAVWLFKHCVGNTGQPMEDAVGQAISTIMAGRERFSRPRKAWALVGDWHYVAEPMPHYHAIRRDGQ